MSKIKPFFLLLFLLLGCTNRGELLYETLDCLCKPGYMCENGSDLTSNKDLCVREDGKAYEKFFETLECREHVEIEDLNCNKMKTLIESGVSSYPLYTNHRQCNYPKFNHVWITKINIKNKYGKNCIGDD